jgi:arabinofuranosyltransferase
MGVSAQTASSALGIASGVGILVALVVLSARLWGWRSPACWLAPAALVLSRSFTAWSTGGLATQFFSLLVFLAFAVLFAERRSGSTHPLVSSLLFGLATLTRPEGALFAAVAGGFQLFDLGYRRRNLRTLGLWLAPLVIIVGAHLLWRHSYYGEWLPNTFYVKVSGFSPEKSVPYLRLFLQDYALHWFLPFALLGSLVERRMTVERGLFLAAASLYVAYVFYIGGGVFEFRFLVPVLPMIYWLIADGIRAVARATVAGHSWLPRAFAVVTAATLLVTTHTGSVKPEAKARRGAVTSIPLMRLYAKNRARDGKFLRALVVSGRLAPDTRIAVSGAGALPYFSRLFAVDTLGLNDAFVARQSINWPGVIGHERVATTDYLVSRGVAIHDVMNRLIYRGPPDALPRTMLGRPLRCIEANGKYLLFATTLNDAAFDAVFERFDRVF